MNVLIYQRQNLLEITVNILKMQNSNLITQYPSKVIY